MIHSIFLRFLQMKVIETFESAKTMSLFLKLWCWKDKGNTFYLFKKQIYQMKIG